MSYLSSRVILCDNRNNKKCQGEHPFGWRHDRGCIRHSSEDVGFIKTTSEIDEVVNLINNVTDQTNLLALNVSVEAPRAREVGKGFTGVTSEVEKPARQTQDATKIISEKILLITRE